MSRTHSTIAKRYLSLNKKFRMPMLSSITIIHVILFTCVTIFSVILYTSPANSKILGDTAGIVPETVIELVNRERARYDLTPLTANKLLNMAAENKARDMFARSYWEHYAPDSKTPWEFIADTGYIYKFAGENLARNYYTPESLVTAWMNSEKHRQNILSDKFQETGVAIVRGEMEGKDTVLTVQLFATSFTRSELDQIGKKQALIVNDHSTQNPPLQNDGMTANLSSARLLLTLSVVIAVLYLGLDFRKNLKKAGLARLARRYWLSTVLFVLFCSLYYHSLQIL